MKRDSKEFCEVRRGRDGALAFAARMEGLQRGGLGNAARVKARKEGAQESRESDDCAR